MLNTELYGISTLQPLIRLPGLVGQIINLADIAGAGVTRYQVYAVAAGLKVTPKDFGIVAITATNAALTLSFGRYFNGALSANFHTAAIAQAALAARAEVSNSKSSTNYDWAAAADTDAERELSTGDALTVSVTAPGGTTGIVYMYYRAEISGAVRGSVDRV